MIIYAFSSQGTTLLQPPYYTQRRSIIDIVAGPYLSSFGLGAPLTPVCTRASLINAPRFAVTGMADSQRGHSVEDSDSKYQTFDVGGPKGEPQHETKKRSTLLTVCPFILGKLSRFLCTCAQRKGVTNRCIATPDVYACCTCPQLCFPEGTTIDRIVEYSNSTHTRFCRLAPDRGGCYTD